MNTAASSNIVKTEFFVKASNTVSVIVVKAAKPISACGKHIEEGAYLFIDTTSQPEDGKLFLCGMNIEAFTNQDRISGVVRGIYTQEL